MKLSLVLPSLFPHALRRTIENLQATTRGVDYEVLVVAPFEVVGTNVVWIPEGNPRGGVAANIAAYERASGDLVVTLSDEIALADNWAEICLKMFHEREPPGRHFCLGLHLSSFVVGTVFGIYYPFYPMARMSTLRAVGGHFDPIYTAHFPDPDLALRIWQAGGRCERTEIPLVSQVPRPGSEAADPPTKTSRSAERDTATFVWRWAPIYGSGWKTGERGEYNIDIDAIFELLVGDECWVFLNDPIFKRLHRNYLRNAARWKIGGAGVPRS